MSKIELFGNRFRKFLKLLRMSINNHRSPQRIIPASSPISGCILPADLLCKNRGKVASPPEIFSACGSSSSFPPLTVQCPKSSFLETSFENFFKLLRTSINIHRSPHESCRHCLLSAASYSPLPFYVKIGAKWKPFLNTFSEKRRSASSSANTVLIQAALLSFAPPYLHGENQRFWKHLSKIFLQRRSSC